MIPTVTTVTKIGGLLALLLLVTACHPKSHEIKPTIVYFPQSGLVKSLPSPFISLSLEEKESAWGKELLVGAHFARQMDFYRAITAYERAWVLCPQTKADRRHEIEYNIFLSYYLAFKYQDAVEYFEKSSLTNVSDAFPPYRELLIMLYDAYNKLNYDARSCAILELIKRHDEKAAQDLEVSIAILDADLCKLENLSDDSPRKEAIDHLICEYCTCKKSVKKAQTLNALLPGAGYWYVGQKETAMTALLLNTAFAVAAWQFFEHGYTAAGIITLGFESGWYFGGINGAGLAARQYNEDLWSRHGKETMLRNRLFPVLMLHTAF